jgi:hypothetical protein
MPALESRNGDFDHTVEVISFTSDDRRHCQYSSWLREKDMRTIKHLVDFVGEGVFADFGTYVLKQLVRSAQQGTREVSWNHHQRSYF